MDVADNSGAKRAAAIGVIGRNQRYARVGDVIKAHKIGRASCRERVSLGV